MPLAHFVFAANEGKVDICHVDSGNDQADLGGGDALVFGIVIRISANSVPAHVRHGDSVGFTLITEAERAEYEDDFQINLPNADCFFFEPGL